MLPGSPLDFFSHLPKVQTSPLQQLLVSIASNVEFMTFLTIKHIAVRSLLTWLFLRTLGLIISRCYHLQTNAHSIEKFAVSLADSYLSLRLQVKDFSFLDSFYYTRNETFRVRPL